MPVFEWPDEEMPRAERQAMYDRLNGIKLTVEQLQGGIDTFRKFKGDPSTPLSTESRMAALVGYCEAQGLLPAADAADAIYVRLNEVDDFWAGGVEITPEQWDRLATAPLDLSEFGLDSGDLWEA